MSKTVSISCIDFLFYYISIQYTELYKANSDQGNSILSGAKSSSQQTPFRELPVPELPILDEVGLRFSRNILNKQRKMVNFIGNETESSYWETCSEVGHLLGSHVTYSYALHTARIGDVESGLCSDQ